MSESIKSLELLAEQFGKLGGVGKRTAMRLAFSVVDMTEAEAERFAEAILEAKRNIHCCPVCQNLTDLDVVDGWNHIALLIGGGCAFSRVNYMRFYALFGHI